MYFVHISVLCTEIGLLIFGAIFAIQARLGLRLGPASSTDTLFYRNREFASVDSNSPKSAGFAERLHKWSIVYVRSCGVCTHFVVAIFSNF